MKTHTEIGARILSGSRFPLMRLAQEIARSHHESWNGGGYYGLVGENIPLASRIVTVADTFDAITHDRPYRAGRSIRDAIEELRREAGQQFDAEVVEALALVLEREPAQASTAPDPVPATPRG
jgi:putative two-component system response regulator